MIQQGDEQILGGLITFGADMKSHGCQISGLCLFFAGDSRSQSKITSTVLSQGRYKDAWFHDPGVHFTSDIIFLIGV